MAGVQTVKNMETKDMERFDDIYDDMVASKDVKKMHELGKAFCWLMSQVSASNPKLAREVVEKLEASAWNNYLSENEAVEIVSQFVNQDGAKGAKWSYSQFVQLVERIDGVIEDKPYYNRYALWVTMNMIYSDEYRELVEAVGSDKVMRLIYKLAFARLHDPDRSCFIREYFGL